MYEISHDKNDWSYIITYSKDNSCFYIKRFYFHAHLSSWIYTFTNKKDLIRHLLDNAYTPKLYFYCYPINGKLRHFKSHEQIRRYLIDLYMDRRMAERCGAQEQLVNSGAACK
jgi:hypothetical protein